MFMKTSAKHLPGHRTYNKCIRGVFLGEGAEGSKGGVYSVSSWTMKKWVLSLLLRLCHQKEACSSIAVPKQMFFVGLARHSFSPLSIYLYICICVKSIIINKSLIMKLDNAMNAILRSSTEHNSVFLVVKIPFKIFWLGFEIIKNGFDY